MTKVWIGNAPHRRSACHHFEVVVLFDRKLTCALRAGNLPPRISERDIEYEFKPFGRIQSVWVARKPPGFGVHPLLSQPSFRNAHELTDTRCAFKICNACIYNAYIYIAGIYVRQRVGQKQWCHVQRRLPVRSGSTLLQSTCSTISAHCLPS
jgi:hypothetical protein